MTEYFVPPNIFTKIKDMLVRKHVGTVELEFDGSGRITGAWVRVYVPADMPLHLTPPNDGATRSVA
jgi:hypothetical protein